MRIVGRLDIKNSNLIKGVNLEWLRRLGNPNDFALKYIELKKGRASDVVMGQIQRYMGHIKNNLAGEKDVKGLIIALEDDKNLRDALSVAPNIKFMKYEVSFKLVG